MKIKEITDCGIVFDNGNSLTDCHERDYCECNYADWDYLKDEVGGEIFNIDFDENLVFEEYNWKEIEAWAEMPEAKL